MSPCNICYLWPKRNISFLLLRVNFDLTLIFIRDLNSVKMNQHVEYLCQRSFSFKKRPNTQTRAHAVPTDLPGPLKWLEQWCCHPGIVSRVMIHVKWVKKRLWWIHKCHWRQRVKCCVTTTSSCVVSSSWRSTSVNETRLQRNPLSSFFSSVWHGPTPGSSKSGLPWPQFGRKLHQMPRMLR